MPTKLSILFFEGFNERKRKCFFFLNAFCLAIIICLKNTVLYPGTNLLYILGTKRFHPFTMSLFVWHPDSLQFPCKRIPMPHYYNIATGILLWVFILDGCASLKRKTFILSLAVINYQRRRKEDKLFFTHYRRLIKAVFSFVSWHCKFVISKEIQFVLNETTCTPTFVRFSKSHGHVYICTGVKICPCACIAHGRSWRGVIIRHCPPPLRIALNQRGESDSFVKV